eukprot:1761347-Pyramimonas_sp.AAC.1
MYSLAISRNGEYLVESRGASAIPLMLQAQWPTAGGVDAYFAHHKLKKKDLVDRWNTSDVATADGTPTGSASGIDLGTAVSGVDSRLGSQYGKGEMALGGMGF